MLVYIANRAVMSIAAIIALIMTWIGKTYDHCHFIVKHHFFYEPGGFPGIVIAVQPDGDSKFASKWKGFTGLKAKVLSQNAW